MTTVYVNQDEKNMENLDKAQDKPHEHSIATACLSFGDALVDDTAEVITILPPNIESERKEKELGEPEYNLTTLSSNQSTFSFVSCSKSHTHTHKLVDDNSYYKCSVIEPISEHHSAELEYMDPLSDADTSCIGKDIVNCIGLQRIISLLAFHNCHHNECDALNEYLTRYNLRSHLMNDYHHILDKHLNDDTISKKKIQKQFELIYAEMVDMNGLYCDIKSCDIWKRHHRIREHTQIEHVFVDIADTIHCYFLHSVDIGHRMIGTQYKQYMAAKDVDLTQLRQYLRDNKIYTMHMKKDARFVTKLRQNSHEMRGYLRKESLYLKQVRLRYIVLSSHHLYSYKTDQCIELTESIDLNEYSHAEMSEHGPIGQFELISSKKQMKRRVFIGKSMAELDDWLSALRAVMKHKQNWYDKPHFGERFDYWSNDSSYPQYESMKEEMTSNKTHSLSVAAFECALNKAIYLHNCHKIRNMIPCRDVTDKYHLRYDAAPSVDHILAIVLWCDYRELSVALKRSFARISKAKYDELWIYSKYLIECVNAFGQRLKKSKHKSCYHLMECGHYMEYETMFNGAISTTTMPSVVLLKKQRDGVVLELTNYKKLRYFACPFVSYFGNENERLFISPPFVDKHCNYFAHIVSISDDICCYAQYIEPLNVLKQLLNNEVIDECMVMDGCKYLLSILLQQECVVAPPYVRNVLREWSDTVHHIRFNSYLNNKIVCDLDLYCQNIEYLVRFDKLNLMFKRLSTVHIDKNTIDIGNHDTMQYDWTCIASMLSMLDNINHNKHSQLKQIAIQCNDQMEITNWIQYKQLIADKKWSICHKDKIIKITRTLP
eukprot:46317_1